VKEIGRIAYLLLTTAARTAQFMSGIVMSYAASYGVGSANSALTTAALWFFGVNIVAWLIARRLFAGWWASALGLLGFFAAALPRLASPVCPGASSPCVISPGMYVVTLLAFAGIIAIAAILARTHRGARSSEDR
jgi:hypothetical protein